MNKAELIDALAARLGDKKAANAALDAVLTEIQQAVTKGDKVAITGFGVFEKRVRGARTARNPRTGESVKVKKTSVPAFRAGAGFRDMVASGKVPKVAPAKKTATAATATKKATTAVKSTATKAATATKTAAKTATKTAAKTTATAAKTTAKAAAPVKKTTTTKSTRAAATPARKTTTAATTAKSAPTSAAPARKAPAKKR